MNLPPIIRQVQQSVYWHLTQSAALAAATAYFTCDPTKQEQSCITVGVAAFFGALYLSFQHSPRSVAFHDDGTPNKLVETAVAVQKAAAATPPGSDAHRIATSVAGTVSEAAAILKVKP